MLKQNKKPTITFNRVTALLYLTHLFDIILVFGKGFLGGMGGEQHIFYILITYVQ